MASEPVARAVAEEVGRWGSMKQTGVSLRYMMEFGSVPTERNLLLSAQFLHKELPIRIARRALELDSLPFGLSAKPAILKAGGRMFSCWEMECEEDTCHSVRDWYMDSFRDIRYFPEVKNRDDELAFTQMIKMIKVRHNNVVPTMALGVQQLKNEQFSSRKLPPGFDEIHEFLDRFYMSRIGIRMLIGQHVALHDPEPEPGVIGLINTKLSPIQVAQIASEDARSICLREYGSAPDINIYGDPNFTFPYVASHLHLMLFELVKNSLRAVQEKYMNSDKDVPPVRIIVADGTEDVTIKVSDEGGGIRRSGLPRIFTYLYSTAKNLPDIEGPSEGVTMAGYGFGLPVSRLYARYFGGDLQIISMEGYGTDAYLHLSRLGDSEEPLP
ncbi:pyruvate dehydrogenase (acetyl-transferring) kinase, mitochondrial-like isoform X1 [Lolium rigidum]|uniref:pyruvate dehydrogenase (acetyl-transferring) kinase, mitochondrial-like isoform X1 n=1 Tax=Lolium rigidum TaxID=89674 RepID=UPI001F5D45E0|nr:pyruvate dehydrogenase (acetyl-transferring) kinase, mitochondrial-like isoform X1 [Lolium rigidum]